MGRKSRITTEKKLECVLRCINGEASAYYIAQLVGVTKNTVARWIRNYQSLGIKGLTTASKNVFYSKELKHMAVKDYLDNKGSLNDICRKYGIRSSTQLRKWIMKYNSHDKLKSSGTGGVTIMTKGRKTTYEERVDIVKYCIEHQNNYSKAASFFQVSYQQVYT